jgi:hypothetical protein
VVAASNETNTDCELIPIVFVAKQELDEGFPLLLLCWLHDRALLDAGESFQESSDVTIKRGIAIRKTDFQNLATLKERDCPSFSMMDGIQQSTFANFWAMIFSSNYFIPDAKSDVQSGQARNTTIQKHQNEPMTCDTVYTNRYASVLKS